MPQADVSNKGIERETFRIRHLKAGCTGARKTWSAAPVLLDYLVLRGGLRLLKAKRIGEGNPLFDMAPNDRATAMTLSRNNERCCCNVLELGSGSGFLSVGLVKAFRRSSMSSSSLSSPTTTTCHRDDVKIMCTDMDRNTIKNMRHNVCENGETKVVAIKKLKWGNDVGGDIFSMALARKFEKRKEKVGGRADSTDSSLLPPILPRDSDLDDPVGLLTHVNASDVHYKETTLDPLLSIVASMKLRNPNIQVSIMMKERSLNAAAEVAEGIRRKVNENGQGFIIVHVRDVIQTGVPNLKMKLVEC